MALTTNWARWLGNTSASMAGTHYGTYSIQHSTILSIISINTMFYEVENWWLYDTTMAYVPMTHLCSLSGSSTSFRKPRMLASLCISSDMYHSDAQIHSTTIRCIFDQIVQAVRGDSGSIFYIAPALPLSNPPPPHVATPRSGSIGVDPRNLPVGLCSTEL